MSEFMELHLAINLDAPIDNTILVRITDVTSISLAQRNSGYITGSTVVVCTNCQFAVMESYNTVSAMLAYDYPTPKVLVAADF